MTLLTAEEVAELLHVALITVYKWTAQNKIPHVHLSPKCVRYPLNLLQEWIDAKAHNVEFVEAGKIKTRKEKPRRNGFCKSNIDCIIESVKREVMG